MTICSAIQEFMPHHAPLAPPFPKFILMRGFGPGKDMLKSSLIAGFRMAGVPVLGIDFYGSPTKQDINKLSEHQGVIIFEHHGVDCPLHFSPWVEISSKEEVAFRHQ